MAIYYKEKESLQDFYTFWQQIFPALEDFHTAWIAKNAKVLHLKKGQILFEAPEEQKNLYIVLRGILVKEIYSVAGDKKQILAVAMPMMGFFTTMYYDSQSPALGNIVAINQGITLQIPYKKIKPFYNNDKGIDTLLNLLIGKNKDQLDHLRFMDTNSTIKDRLFYLAGHLPELYHNLTQNELARLLHVSESSIFRAKKRLLKRNERP